jgi:predicted porin
MKKKIVVTAIAAAIATPAIVNAEAIMYGKVRVASQYHNRGDAFDTWGMEDQQSRLGVKGEEDLGGGLKGIFQLEFGVNVGEGAGKTSIWSQRNSFVGLAGPFGTVLAGKHDTPFKLSTVKLDFFIDTNVDNDDQGSFAGDFNSTKGVGLFDSLRVDGAIAYVSPNFAGVTLMGAVVQIQTDADFEDADHGLGAYSLAATYSNGPWFASAAYETIEPDNLAGIAGDNYYKWRVGVGMLEFNNISASLIYEDRDNTDFVNDDTSSWQFSAAYDITGNLRVKGMYGQYLYNDNDDTAFDTWAIGLEHKFSKRTDVQVMYRQKELDDNLNGGLDIQDNVFAVQLDHSF